MEHSLTSATGTAWERTPWHATQRAAWDALKRASLVLGSVFLPLPPLKFPSHKAPMMEAIADQSAGCSVEFNLELGQVRLQQFATYRTAPSSPTAAMRAVLTA